MSVRIPFRGVVLDQPTIDALLLAERILGYPLELMQGSWSTGVAASAGTHAGGGALDAAILGMPDLEQRRIVRALRQAGFAAWRRTPSQGFAYHVHCILVGDTLVSAPAADQLVQWRSGRDGLASHGPDVDPVDAAAGRPAVIPAGGTVPRTMYDAVTLSNVPSGAAMVACYADGTYQNEAEARSRFPHAVIVTIAVRASFNGGQVLDVETGDASPDEAPGWVVMRRAAGADPTVYCNTSTWPAVKAAFAAAGVAPPHYWVAQYDNNPVIPAGAVAKQYSDLGPYDLSVVADVWPGIDTGGIVSTPADIANAVWNHTEADATTGAQTRVGAIQRYIDTLRTAQTAAINAHTDTAVASLGPWLAEANAKIDALTTAVSSLATIVAGLSSPTITDAQIAALAAALGPELGAAVADVLAQRLVS